MIKIFQIYFKEELAKHCDASFEPLSNVANPRPDLREWDVWNRNHETIAKMGLDLWGYVSWKFKEKTGLEGKQFLEFINANPGYDVYFVNPCIINEAVFINSWEQGDIHHPNISAIGNTFLNKIGYDTDVRSIVLDHTKTMFANYVVGTPAFWNKFMEFSRRLFIEAEKDKQFGHQVFGEGLSNYAYDKSLPNFTFLIERLIPTFIELEGFKSLGYTYTASTLPAKYKPYYADITALSTLKMQINKYESDELFDIWNYYRRKFLEANPGVLGLE